MSEQLQLFTSDFHADTSADSPDSTNALVEQTKELLHHNGTTDELIERIMTAVKVLDELCQAR